MKESTDFVNFDKALRLFVQETCSIFSKTRIITRRWTKIVHMKKGWSFPEAERPDYSQTSFMIARKFRKKPPVSLLQIMNTIKNVPELANVLLVDAMGNPIREEKMQLFWLINILAGKFICRYLENVKKIEFDEKIFITVLDQLNRD